MPSNLTATEVVNRLVDAFLAEHPEYQKVHRQRLCAGLVGVYESVLRGTYIAKTEEHLAGESHAAGIARNHYLDVVNMTAHEADDSAPLG